MQNLNFRGIPAAAALAIALSSTMHAQAAESLDTCTGFIRSIPVEITRQGTWCLGASLQYSQDVGNAVSVQANNVTIDCNHHGIDGRGAGAESVAVGISNHHHANTTVRNCNLRGFMRGIELLGGGGHLVENNHVEDSLAIGIDLHGDLSVVRGNRVLRTGGPAGSPHRFGIRAGKQVDVLDNVVLGVRGIEDAISDASGIALQDNIGGAVAGNHVAGLARGSGGNAFGIVGTGQERLSVHDNTLAGAGEGRSYGIRCISAGSRAEHNTITGFQTGLSGCGNGGGNDVAP